MTIQTDARALRVQALLDRYPDITPEEGHEVFAFIKHGHARGVVLHDAGNDQGPRLVEERGEPGGSAHGQAGAVSVAFVLGALVAAAFLLLFLGLGG
ncbi:MAG TPA: hypothetical protein VGC46_07990 [Allosphingosinicella sp.]